MIKKNMLKIVLGIVVITSVTTSCYRDKEDLLYQTQDCSNASVQPGAKFTAVEAIINSQCTGCHSPSGGQSPDLSTKCSIVERWNAINNECVIDQSMPTSGPLSAEDQQAITDWINAGHAYTN